MGGMIYTIGHWDHSEDDFLDLLHQHDVDLIVDVRSYPGSRRSPQFNQENLPYWLEFGSIAYTHIPLLGGHRKAVHVSDPMANAGWKNASFKNYADYTLTDYFWRGISDLFSSASGYTAALMCGEPMPWRCHRLLISNVLAKLWSIDVVHILPDGDTLHHQFGGWGATPVYSCIMLEDEESVEQITYPARQFAR